MSTVHEEDVAAVRAFNRFYTAIIGVLDEGLLASPDSLTQARVLFELAQRGQAPAAALRGELRLDAGYLSRILARLESDGLVDRSRSDADGRRQQISLTEAGREAFRVLDERSSAEVSALLSPLTSEEQARLVAAMATIRRLLGGPAAESVLVLRPPRAGELGWVVARHGALYAEEFGWDDRFEALVARIVADYVDHRDPRLDAAWIAELDGEPVGCVFCVNVDEETAQLRLLLVEPSARGQGVGGRLVEECLRFARGAGYAEVVLWTNDVLDAARRIYQRAGFELRRQEAHDSFGDELVGQYWGLRL